MAKETLACAAELARRYPSEVAARGVSEDESLEWDAAAAAMCMPRDELRDLPAQDNAFNAHQVLNFEVVAREHRYPLLLHSPYFSIYRKQVCKQADLVLAMHWCGNQFSARDKARAFEYYEAVTVRDSSLSACTQAIIAAEVGHLELAHDYLAEAALMDLRDLESNAADGLHIASLAGAWLAVVAGFGGMRDHDGQLSFSPQLPERMRRLCFRVRWQQVLVRVEIVAGQATYTVEDGPGTHLNLVHHGEAFTVVVGEPVTLPYKNVEPSTPRPTQPVGRAPIGSQIARDTGESQASGV